MNILLEPKCFPRHKNDSVKQSKSFLGFYYKTELTKDTEKCKELEFRDKRTSVSHTIEQSTACLLYTSIPGK